ncbi:MAG TPA: CAP domain-containing protein, partial [Candidatus Saccharimonadales bacterium]|nr:CAP domain-containing protein [Candidatus Saccharimonadales bacterium]
QALWAGYTGYGQSPASLIMEGDGNLVEFNTASQSVWNSGTAGSGSGNYLVMQNDGDLVMYTADGTPVWSSQTGAIASASVPAGSLNAYPGTVQSNHRSVLKWNQPGVTCSAPFYLGTLPGSGSYTTNPLSGPGGSYYIGCKANPPQTYAYIRQVNVNALPTTPSSPPPFSSQPAIVSGTISLINNYRATYSEPALSEARCLDAAASKYALYLATIHAPTVPEINSDTLNSDIANACGSSYIKAGSNTGANAGESWVADSSDASIATANTGIFNSMVGEKLCYAVVNITCPDDHRINILSYIKYPFVYNFNQIGVGAYYDPATQDLFVTTFFAQP